MRLAQITNALSTASRGTSQRMDGSPLHEIVRAASSVKAPNLDLSAFVNPRPDAEIDEQGIAHIHVTGTLASI